MSSPRVLRTVVTMPADDNTAANALTRSEEERSKPDAGNGLKGIKLNLQGNGSLSGGRTNATKALRGRLNRSRHPACNIQT